MKTMLKIAPFLLFAVMLFLMSTLAEIAVSPYIMGIIFNAGLLIILFIKLKPKRNLDSQFY